MIRVDTSATMNCSVVDCVEPILDALLVVIITDEGKQVEENTLFCKFHYNEILKQVGQGQ